ncbi:unnamed protein product [Gordionus sp. m RMFG-2023]|uniref:carbonic anhydrase 1-like n=1 Tax=Gordionus sp. m RMFG-2023 TaxID=3053472 RepID=UPI0030E5C35B
MKIIGFLINHKFVLLITIIIHVYSDLTRDKIWGVRADIDFSYREGCIIETWGKKYPSCVNVPYTRTQLAAKSNGNLSSVESPSLSVQSPINIRTSETIKAYFKDYSLHFRNYELESPVTGTWRIEKTRYGFLLKVNGILPFIEVLLGDGKAVAYEFVQAHFHWGVGGGSTVGSEHSIDCQFYQLEGHLLHRSLIGKQEKLAVVAVFYELIDEKEGGAKESAPEPKNLRAIVDAIKSSENELKSEIPINTSFSLNFLLPESVWQTKGNTPFYKYLGSLTAPPCSETVTWLIIKEPAKISLGQLSALENLKLCNEKDHTCFPDKYVGSNRRPTQPTNKRPIYFVSANGRAAVITNLYDWQILSMASLFGIIIGAI